MKVKEIYMTCSDCPSQWEGFLEDGRMFYARYRWGNLTLDVSDKPTNDVFTAMDGDVIIDKVIGGEFDGSLTTDELKSIMIEYNFKFD